MPTNYIFSNIERLYAVKETTFGTIPTVANGDYFKHIGGALSHNPTVPQRPDKTGILSQVPGIVVARDGSFNVRASLAGSGVAATVPDIDVLIANAFGADATAGVYSLADTVPSFSLFSFRTGGIKRVASGCVVNELVFAWGQNFAEVSASGPCVWIPDDASFASLDTAGKGGLASMRTEPATPTWAGVPVSGGIVSLAIGAYSLPLAGGGSLKMTLNRELRHLGKKYSQCAIAGNRVITIEATAYDSDDSGLSTMLSDAILSNAIATASLVFGDTTGNIFTFAGKKLVLQGPAWDDSNRSWEIKLSGQFNSSDGVAKDELTLTCG